MSEPTPENPQAPLDKPVESAQGEDIYYRPEIGTALHEDYMREDERWSEASQVRDWIILLVIGFLQFLWMYIVFVLEPGIR